MKLLARALRLSLWLFGPQFENPWTVFSFLVAVFITGTTLRAMLPAEAVALPTIGALSAGAAVAWVVHRVENPPRRTRPVHARVSSVTILPDPPQR